MDKAVKSTCDYKTKRERCMACYGSGRITIHNYPHTKRVHCKLCAGTGHILVSLPQHDKRDEGILHRSEITRIIDDNVKIGKTGIILGIPNASREIQQLINLRLKSND